MLFSSMTFVFVFLPIVCSLYLLCRKELKNLLLLIASLIFYAWGEPEYLSIMLFTIIINYIAAICLEKFKYKKLLLFITILINISFLIYFKYFNFILENINLVFHTNINLIKVIMPIGISFYTFQALSYILDVYRGEVKAQKNIYKLALFICLFPQLIAGPIIKYHDIEKQIDERDVNFDKVTIGVKRFISGLSKKMLLANTFGMIADKIFVQPPDTFTPLTAWLGAFTYTMQLYYDFSGYSDMAIGLGLIFGFNFLENFNYPYISKSITEFWRRWHISLSTWFKQYVYIPLGGNRKGKIKTYFNLFFVFVLTGIWHGANWTFLIWGIYNGLFIILEKMTGFNNETTNKALNIVKHLYAILIFVIGWVIFRSDNIAYAIKYIKNMFGLTEVSNVLYEYPYYCGKIEIILMIAGVIFVLPIFRNIIYIKNKFIKFLVNLWFLILFILSAFGIAVQTYNPFIYFRF